MVIVNLIPDDPGAQRDRELLTITTWAKREPFGVGERPPDVIIDAYYDVLYSRLYRGRGGRP
jgi:hypothetical protein